MVEQTARSEVSQAECRMRAMAREEGLDYSLDRLNANAFDLHRVVQYANDQGRGFAFFSDVQEGFLTSDEYADRVRADRREGAELGATGVPFVVLDRRVAAPGPPKVPVHARSLGQAAGPAPSEGVAGERHRHLSPPTR